jgi:DNA-binding CsgD family transcriptional regulator
MHAERSHAMDVSHALVPDPERFSAEAVRHAQAARDWSLAARLLSDHFTGLILDGEGATAAYAGLGVIRLWRMRLEEAAALLDQAERTLRGIGGPSAEAREILELAPGHEGGLSSPLPRAKPHERLSKSEARVLRFLPTSLSVPEIADQLFVSVNTVRTHMRHVYEKLGAHRRAEAVDRARALGLLSLSCHRP